jgi:phosphate starvation-inducible PhoH-like protein
MAKLDILKKKFPLLKILSRGKQLKLSGLLSRSKMQRKRLSSLFIPGKERPHE